jgi:hypothetical protein
VPSRLPPDLNTTAVPLSQNLLGEREVDVDS